MKKLIAILLTLVLTLSLAACGSAPSTEAPAQTPDTTLNEHLANAPTEPVAKEAFYFMLDEVKLIPGAAFDPNVLPEANDLYEVPSCAIEGTDNVYSYDTMELTAYNDGTGEVIYSIYLMDPNTPTVEGLYMGDDRAAVEGVYGTDYQENEGELVYTKGATQLIILLEDDLVVSIEYRMVTE